MAAEGEPAAATRKRTGILGQETDKLVEPAEPTEAPEPMVEAEAQSPGRASGRRPRLRLHLRRTPRYRLPVGTETRWERSCRTTNRNG